MEEIIKILEEHNIKCLVTNCVSDSDDLTISHKNFYVNIDHVTSYNINENTGWIEFSNGIVKVIVYYDLEYIHITVL